VPICSISTVNVDSNEILTFTVRIHEFENRKYNVMSKTALKLFVASALLIGYSSCKTFKDLSKQKDGDDVYYSMNDAKKERAAEKKRQEEAAKREQEEAKKREAEANNAKAMATSPGTDYYEQPFDYDDYYDYEYAARLRRFHDPVPGSGYYDNYYTNAYYYNQNPNYYGTSVYNSYSFWGPSAYAYNYCPSSYFYYNSGWAWGTGMYYGNPYGNPYGYGYYDPWMNQGWGYSPYYSYYPGWNGGWYGPMTPMYAGYWGGYGLGYGNGYGGYGYGGFGYNNGGNGSNYFNSYDDNSYYYGPRHSPSSTDGRVAGTGGPAFGERYATAIAQENNLQNAEREEVNRVTRETYAASAANTGRTQTSPAVTPSVSDPQPANTNAGRDAAPAYSNSQTQTQQRDNVPPAPVFGTTAPAPTATQQRDATPPAPDYNRPSPSNTQPAPANNSQRDNTPTYSAPAPSNNGGGNNGGNSGPRNSNSGGGSGNRPR
jgi:hypothetical protein